MTSEMTESKKTPTTRQLFYGPPGASASDRNVTVTNLLTIQQLKQYWNSKPMLFHHNVLPWKYRQVGHDSGANELN